MKLFVENITQLDFSYLDRRRGLLGETWHVDVELEGEQDDQGMLWDFGLVKKTIKNWMDQTLDHVLVVPEKANWIELRASQHFMEMGAKLHAGAFTMKAPHGAFSQVPLETIDMFSVAEWAADAVRKELPKTVTRCRFKFYPEDIAGSYYHYSHGLKHHVGNCQRIAHGHRSAIQIKRGENRDTDCEQLVADYLADSYLGLREDLVKLTAKTAHFRYSAAQGDFELMLPAQQVRLLDVDTTVENIALWLAQGIVAQYYKADDDNQRLTEVRAYEGIGKGAIAAL